MGRRAIDWAEEPLSLDSTDDFIVRMDLVNSASIQIGSANPIMMHWTNRDSNLTLVVFTAAIRSKSVKTVPVFPAEARQKICHAILCSCQIRLLNSMSR